MLRHSLLAFACAALAVLGAPRDAAAQTVVVGGKKLHRAANYVGDDLPVVARQGLHG